MAFCVGGAWCRRQKCRNRCKSWFGQQPDLERQCKAACQESISFSREDFLCSGNWVDDAAVILSYGYDPCPGTGASIVDILDPLGDRDYEEKKRKDLEPIYIGGGLLLLAALIILVTLVS